MVYNLGFRKDSVRTLLVQMNLEKMENKLPIQSENLVEYNVKFMIFFLQSLGLVLAHNMLCVYLQSGVVTTLNSTTGNIVNAEFPALHICNSYQIRSKKQLFLLPMEPMPFG